ncbi:hypothetical protein EYF80_014069 [Liparis tanakae]|uniref:Uncharacterized protein n=1 Tax=Liparis tanakae TaxID=230148 RepID=A0A4Z2ICN5_9TELE|nr:hypothetical protein EYF80_014069 [Liparis tanakae]
METQRTCRRKPRRLEAGGGTARRNYMHIIHVHQLSVGHGWCWALRPVHFSFLPPSVSSLAAHSWLVQVHAGVQTGIVAVATPPATLPAAAIALLTSSVWRVAVTTRPLEVDVGVANMSIGASVK